MSESFMEISSEDIERIANVLDVSDDYKLKDSKFDTDNFEEGKEIKIVQYVVDVENELIFKTKFEDGKYFISGTFDLFKDNILSGNASRNVFQSVNDYFWDVIENGEDDFEEKKEDLIKFLMLTEEYDEDELNRDLDPLKIRNDYRDDYEKVYGDDSLDDVQKSLALKELIHMSICYLVNDLDMFFTRPLNLTGEEIAEKNRQEAKALQNEMKLA